MASRQEIEQELGAKIAAGEDTISKLKAKLADAGDEASAETREALAKAESLLDKGRTKLGELANATDDEFDELWADTKDAWSDMTAGIESGWDKVSDRVRDFFS